MLPSRRSFGSEACLAAPRARLAERLGGFVTYPREECGLGIAVESVVLLNECRQRGCDYRGGLLHVGRGLFKPDGDA